MSLRVEFYLIDKIEDLKSNIQRGDKELMEKAISSVLSDFESETPEESEKIIREIFAKKTTAISEGYGNIACHLSAIVSVLPGFSNVGINPLLTSHSFYQELYDLFRDIDEKSHFTKVLEYTSSPRHLFTGEPEFDGWNYYSYILQSEATPALLEMPTILTKIAEDSDAKETINNILRTVLEESALLKKDIFIFAD